MAADHRTDIEAAVGMGQPNDPADVSQVQHLLNCAVAAQRGNGALKEDGMFGPLTRARLTDYQRDIVGLAHPDAVVDTHGPTMRSLTGAPADGSAATADGRHGGIHDIAASPSPVRSQRHESRSTQAWIQRVLPAARAVQEKWRVRVSATIAQGAVSAIRRVWCPLSVSVGLIAATTPALAAYTDDQLVDRVHRAVVSHRLYAYPSCIDYTITRKVRPGIDEVELREHHGGKCIGDPDTDPRIFDVIVDRKTGELATNAAHSDEPFPYGFVMLK